MRVVKRDMRHGVMVIRLENADDMWHLESIVRPGDLVKTRTMRKVAVKAGGEYTMSEKKPMVLEVRVEKTGFDETTGTLRISGRITEGPSDTKLSSYHTLEAEAGTVLTIRKASWSSADVKRIKESQERQPVILVCVMDRDEADIAVVKGSGMNVVSHIECDDPEDNEKDRERYHSDVEKVISSRQDADSVIVAGPGFEAGNFMRYLKQKSSPLAGKAFLEGASHTGVTGINEVLRRSGEQVLNRTRIAKETRIVDEVLSRVKSDGLVEYGRAEVEKAIDSGAVERLVVSRERLSDFSGLVQKCERMGGDVSVVTADHSAGEQHLHIGGISALLRFRLSTAG